MYVCVQIDPSIPRLFRSDPFDSLQDFWMDCMKSVPLIKECSALMENQLRKFEEDLVVGYDCSLVDLRTCVHKDGHENYGRCFDYPLLWISSRVDSSNESVF